MKMPIYQFVAQMAAALAVVASLALVAWELKQSRDIGIATLHQQSAASMMDFWSNSNQNEPLVAAWLQLREDPSRLTRSQISRLSWNVTGFLFQTESDFITYRMGLMDEKSWAGRLESIRIYAEMPCYVNYWETIARREFSTHFVAEVERVWAMVEKADCPL